MAVCATVRRSLYQDSLALMRLAACLRRLPGVHQAAALMGTPPNHQLLADAGLATAGVETAGPADLIAAIEAETEALARAALDQLDELMRQGRPAGPVETVRPRTLESALKRLPGANLALISVPGEYAAFEATQALRRGLHVFLFSDNVTVEAEVGLKQLAARRGLLCMGPDCGTAYLHGAGLGFANVVPRGKVGCVAASGTGLQALASGLAALGEGISQGIGVGGRDLSAEVGGLMTRPALEALAADPGTEVIVLVSKPPAPGVMASLAPLLDALGKPVVVCCLGAPWRALRQGQWVETLEDAAACAAALRRGVDWRPRPVADPADVRKRLARLARRSPGGSPVEGGQRGQALLGLFSGGTLAYEARMLLEPHLGPLASNLGPGGGADGHRLLDLGADEFTVGRPHPMLDVEDRAARIRQAGRTPSIGVVLLDLVLGRGVHEDPAGPIAAAIGDARAAAAAGTRVLAVVASVVGTDEDPQGRSRQAAALEAAGAEVLPSSAQAARFAALVLRPELEATLLEGGG